MGDFEVGGTCCLLHHVCTAITSSRAMDQPGKVTNSARGQLNSDICFPCPRSRLRIWSRETGSTVPSRVSLVILHTQTESGAYSRDFSRFPRWRPFLYTVNRHRVNSEFISHATAYRWRSLPRHRQHRTSSPQVSSSNRCCLFRYHHGAFFVRFSFFHAHYSQARTGTRKYSFSLDHEEDWQPYPVDPYSAICNDHSYIIFVQ